MMVTGWSNGRPNLATGAGYGVRIDRQDRDTRFRRNWTSVCLQLEAGQTVWVTLSPAFWRGCSEVRSARIGRWMLENGMAPWPKGRPPRLRLEPTGEAEFQPSTV